MPGQRTHELVADPELAKHQRRALLDSSEELVQSVVEAERQDGEDALIRSDAQIGAHDARAGQQVAVAQHHPFRAACGAGGVEDCREVLADGLGSRRGGAVLRAVAVARQDLQVAEIIEGPFELAQHWRRAQQDTGAAIDEDVANLRRLQRRVDGNEHGVGAADGEDRGAFLEGLREIDRNPIAALDAGCDQAAGQGLDRAREIAIGVRALCVHDGLAAAEQPGVLQKVMQQREARHQRPLRLATT